MTTTSYEQSGYSLGGESPTLKDDKDVKKFMDWAYQWSYPANAAFWNEAYIDKRFVAGDQSLYSTLYGSDSYQKGRRFFFNMLLRQRNMISGYQRRNRKSTIVLPNNDNDKLADDYSQVLKWLETRNSFHEFFSKAFTDCLDTGLGFVHLYPDYTRDPFSGDLLVDTVDFNSILIDPYSSKFDLSDAQFAWRRRWVNREAAKMLLPDKASEIDKLKPTGSKDGRFPLQAELLNLSQSDLFTYDEFYYRDFRDATMIHDPTSGEAVEWEKEFSTAEENRGVEEWLAAQPWLETHKTKVPTVKLAICVSNEVLYNGPNLLNVDRYPFVPLVCYHEPSLQSYSKRRFGVIRNARDAQYLLNRRKVIELDILESQVNSGWIYPVDAVVDEKAFRQKGQGYLIPLKAGRSPQEVQRIEAPGIPESMIRLSQQLNEDMTQTIGTNEELLGSAEDDKAGILSMLRQSAGLTTLQSIFDNADFAQRIFGKLALEAVRRNWTVGKVRSVLNRDPDPQFFTSQSLKYSVEVEQGSFTATQRQAELKQKLYMREIGLPISAQSILKSATFSDKADVLEEMQQQEQQEQQQQQEQQRAEAQKQAAEERRKQEQHQADMMKAFAESKERIAKAEQSGATTYSKISSAHRDEQQAQLDYVKELMKLSEMDLTNLKKSLELAEWIKEKTEADASLHEPEPAPTPAPVGEQAPVPPPAPGPVEAPAPGHEPPPAEPPPEQAPRGETQAPNVALVAPQVPGEEDERGRDEQPAQPSPEGPPPPQEQEQMRAAMEQLQQQIPGQPEGE